jgi:hypothetical protein
VSVSFKIGKRAIKLSPQYFTSAKFYGKVFKWGGFFFLWDARQASILYRPISGELPFKEMNAQSKPHCQEHFFKPLQIFEGHRKNSTRKRYYHSPHHSNITNFFNRNFNEWVKKEFIYLRIKFFSNNLIAVTSSQAEVSKVDRRLTGTKF